METPRELKVVLLGETGVGKSSIVLRYVGQHVHLKTALGPKRDAVVAFYFPRDSLSLFFPVLYLSSFVTNSYERYSESTIGASFMSKMIIVDAKPMKFQIWDTAGQGACGSCKHARPRAHCTC